MSWTTVTLAKVSERALKDALNGAHAIAAAKMTRRPRANADPH